MEKMQAGAVGRSRFPKAAKHIRRDAARHACVKKAATHRFYGEFCLFPARRNKNGEKRPFCRIFRRFPNAFGVRPGKDFHRNTKRNPAKTDE
ncbi:hypothetical protein [Faecalispora jeddahensis]|uniref:hypothetical protein n=1 Tax=Faecalispora jeddahensis TaxID=1414721 RepID=UPI0028A91305|nr:hypothetical protein [Faecalispora jeddahensis]